MKKIGKKGLIGLGILILLAIGSIVFYVNKVLGDVEQVSLKKEDLNINETVNSQEPDVKNIALFGVDAKDAKDREDGNSDAIMILSLNNKEHSIKLTSLSRDAYVDIDGHGKDKLNKAYALGGPELAIKTINQNFDLNLDDFISVNIETVPAIIDILGGVEIDIKDYEIDEMNGYISKINMVTGKNSPFISEAGVQQLDGNQAAAYSGIRMVEGGDYKSPERHRVVLTALFKKFKDIDISKIPAIFDEVAPMTKTSLDKGEMVNLAIEGVKSKGGVQQERFPQDNNSEGHGTGEEYYVTYDVEKTKSDLHKWIFTK